MDYRYIEEQVENNFRYIRELKKCGRLNSKNRDKHNELFVEKEMAEFNFIAHLGKINTELRKMIDEIHKS